MRLKFISNVIITLTLIISTYANAGLITKDYSVSGDGLLTVDTVSNLEWLDVTIFYGMNFNLLQGDNQWTNDGFRLASDLELATLFTNIGSTYVIDGTGALGYGTAHTSASQLAIEQLQAMMNNGTTLNGGFIHGILADSDNDGNSTLGRIGDDTTHVNGNGEHWGDTFISNSVVGAFYVRALKVPEPSTLAIFALGMIGLASRRYNKKS